MIPNNLLAREYQRTEESQMLLVVMEYPVWLSDPVAFSLVYNSIVSRGHACIFVSPVGQEVSLAPPGILYTVKYEYTMKQWIAQMGYNPDIWIGGEK